MREIALLYIVHLFINSCTIVMGSQTTQNEFQQQLLNGARGVSAAATEPARDEIGAADSFFGHDYQDPKSFRNDSVRRMHSPGIPAVGLADANVGEYMLYMCHHANIAWYKLFTPRMIILSEFESMFLYFVLCIYRANEQKEHFSHVFPSYLNVCWALA